MSTVQPSWLTAFLDVPAGDVEAATGFWGGVTGFDASARRGTDGEFRTLVPPEGEPYLRLQRVGDGPARLHLDLHVADPGRAADAAVALGAEKVADRGYVVVRSPGGLLHCFVSAPADPVAPPPLAGPPLSRVYQVCLDIPAAQYDAEVGYWSALLGGRMHTLPERPEFGWITTPPSWALTVLVQRLGEPHGGVRAHLDAGSDDRAVEVARHVALGATVLAEEAFWTVLADPAGLAYCVTDRDPVSAQLHL